MSTSLTAQVRNIEDVSHVLHPMLHLVIQKKAVRPEEVEAAIVSSLRKLTDCLQSQVVALVMLDTVAAKFHVKHCLCGHSLQGAEERQLRAINAEIQRLQTTTFAMVDCACGRLFQGAGSISIDAPPFHTCLDSLLRKMGSAPRTILAMPIKVDGEMKGCIVAVNKCVDGQRVLPFSPTDHCLMNDFVLHAGRVMWRAMHPELSLDSREHASSMARLLKCEHLLLDEAFKLDLALMQLAGEENLKRYHVLPICRVGEKGIRAAVSNPNDFQSLTDFEIATGLHLSEKVVACESEIAAAIDRAFPTASRITKVAERIKREFEKSSDLSASVAELRADNDENSALIVNLANRIIEDAYSIGASDIHVEPQEQNVLVRYRIDGVCRIKLALPTAAHRALVTRLKIMCDLDIAEHRLPQDGRIVFKKFSPKFDLDLRVSIAPMNHGESVVMRILDKTKSCLPLDRLGFSDYNMRLYRQLINIPYGMVLHCGPTGSGKSMTLYAALNEINTPELKVLTAEDPIEYTLPGINQMQMKKDIGLTFANSLRCFLRQDPDVILVGEIRDRETAEIAVEAALTGHVLFSTLHTNDASSTITRLVDIGIEPFLISTTLACICAQRLMRRLCACHHMVVPDAIEMGHLLRARDGSPIAKIGKPVGCERCDKTGYKGRTGIHELMGVTDALRDIIAHNPTAEDLKKAARKLGMRTLFEDAMEKVKAGISSITEALATARPDEEAAPQ
jgi:type IV pilus assembly protein PilB